MSEAAKGYRELEKVLREAADKAAACAEVEEKENPTQEEREEAEKNFMWALLKIQAMEQEKTKWDITAECRTGNVVKQQNRR